MKAPTLLVLLLLAFATSTAHAQHANKKGIQLAFWLNKGQTKDPKSDMTDGHPCGGVSYRTVSRIPKDDRYISTDIVVEFRADGKQITLWRVPIDFWVEAVSADRIQIASNHQRVWVTKDGRVTETLLTPSLHAQQIHCPALKAFDGSQSLQCVRMFDQQSHHPRLLAYQGVCS
jgi:hypothetical protein